MSTLRIDFETKSACDLTKTNAYIYFDSETTDIWCAAWAFDNEEPVLWWPGEPCPDRVRWHIEAGGLVSAWNSAFERLAIRQVLGPKYGWPVPKLEQYRCTMTQAYAMGLPGKLEQAAPALKLPITKDDVGKRIMLQLCKPRKARKGERPDGLYWHDDPEKIARLGAYCIVDVKTEQAIAAILPQLKKSELELWFLDQRMNDRGTFIDENLCLQAQKVVAQTQIRLDAEMRQVTGMAVRGVSNVGELTAFCRQHGVDATSVAKDDLAELLMRDDLSPAVRRALEIRQEGAKTSVAKIGKLLACRQADGRMRGNLQFHGAGPGRWAGRNAQLQNLPVPTVDAPMDEIVRDILVGDSNRLELLYGPALSVVADAVRGMVAAPKKRKILAGDFSQIESRKTAWLGGQHDVLEAFRRADRKEGPDIYIVTAAGIYRVRIDEITKSDPRRQVGKVANLSLGFGGGANALLKMAKKYRMDLLDARTAVLASASPQAVEAAEAAWEARGKATGVSHDRWTTAELIKIAWRKANPATVAMWKTVEEAAIKAVKDPGIIVTAGRLRYRKAGSWLHCCLPSGRIMAYAFPSVRQEPTPFVGADGETIFKDKLHFWAVDGISKKWIEHGAYGGLLFQNAVQGSARDVMADAMKRVEAAGYEPTITIHDEIVAEADEDFGSVEEFGALMTAKERWLGDLPVAAEAWEGPCYKK